MIQRWPKHPFTLFVIALATLVLVFTLPTPYGPIAVAVVALMLALIMDEPGALRRSLLAAFIPSVFLVVLHGFWDPGARIDIGGVLLSRHGLAVAAAQASRLIAVLIVSALTLVRFQPARFIDAAAALGWRSHWAFLLVATVQAVPRFVARARQVAMAQSARGLSRRRNPFARVSGLMPLAVPLVLGAIIEADDRALALDLRGAGRGVARTPLSLPDDSVGERMLRWLLVLAMLGAVAWRIVEWRNAA